MSTAEAELGRKRLFIYTLPLYLIGTSVTGEAAAPTTTAAPTAPARPATA